MGPGRNLDVARIQGIASDDDLGPFLPALGTSAGHIVNGLRADLSVVRNQRKRQNEAEKDMKDRESSTHDSLPWAATFDADTGVIVIPNRYEGNHCPFLDFQEIPARVKVNLIFLECQGLLCYSNLTFNDRCRGKRITDNAFF